MKKLLIILMVVAMAAFLFVGCMPGVTPDVDEDDEDEDDEVLASATPVLVDIQDSAGASIVTVTSTSTQYINYDEAGTSILVTGTAPSESLVTIYIDDVAVVGAVGETATTGLWTVAIAESSLGDDGTKVMTAKVTEVGLAESAASNSATFTLDTDLPGFSVAATASADASGTAADSAVVTATSGTDPISTITLDTTYDVVPGTWTVYCTADSTLLTNNVEVTTPADVTTSYNVQEPSLSYGFIIGFDIVFDASFKAGDGCDVVVTEAGVIAAIVGRATITFDEDVTHAGMAAGTYSEGVDEDPTTYKTATDTGYWTDLALTKGAAFTVKVYGITDLAGNVGGTSASKLSATCTVGTASATSLAP